MEQLLKEIAINTGPKEQYLINVKGNSSRIIERFNPLLQLDKTKRYEMALFSLYTYYSFPNIDSTNNNFRYSPDNGVTWFNMDIPEGSYEIEDINNYIQRLIKDNGHYDTTNSAYYIDIEPNNNTLKSVVNIEAPYKVDFTTANSIRTVLGFNSQIYSVAMTTARWHCKGDTPLMFKQ
jgi:hypothetical protein